MSNLKNDKTLIRIGKNIKNTRISKGYTQEYIAEKLNKSTNFVSLLERGQTGLSVNTIIDICNILEIEPNHLFNGLVKYNKSNNKLIIDTISTLSKEDKEIIDNLIQYIVEKNNN